MEIISYYDYLIFKMQSILKAQPRQRISNIYTYLCVSDQSVYIGSEINTLSVSISLDPDQVKILSVLIWVQTV